MDRNIDLLKADFKRLTEQVKEIDLKLNGRPNSRRRQMTRKPIQLTVDGPERFMEYHTQLLESRKAFNTKQWKSLDDSTHLGLTGNRVWNGHITSQQGLIRPKTPSSPPYRAFNRVLNAMKVRPRSVPSNQNYRPIQQGIASLTKSNDSVNTLNTEVSSLSSRYSKYRFDSPTSNKQILVTSRSCYSDHKYRYEDHIKNSDTGTSHSYNQVPIPSRDEELENREHNVNSLLKRYTRLYNNNKDIIEVTQTINGIDSSPRSSQNHSKFYDEHQHQETRYNSDGTKQSIVEIDREKESYLELCNIRDKQLHEEQPLQSNQNCHELEQLKSNGNFCENTEWNTAGSDNSKDIESGNIASKTFNVKDSLDFSKRLGECNKEVYGEDFSDSSDDSGEDRDSEASDSSSDYYKKLSRSVFKRDDVTTGRLRYKQYSPNKYTDKGMNTPNGEKHRINKVSPRKGTENNVLQLHGTICELFETPRPNKPEPIVYGTGDEPTECKFIEKLVPEGCNRYQSTKCTAIYKPGNYKERTKIFGRNAQSKKSSFAAALPHPYESIDIVTAAIGKKPWRTLVKSNDCREDPLVPRIMDRLYNLACLQNKSIEHEEKKIERKAFYVAKSKIVTKCGNSTKNQSNENGKKTIETKPKSKKKSPVQESSELPGYNRMLNICNSASLGETTRNPRPESRESGSSSKRRRRKKKSSHRNTPRLIDPFRPKTSKDSRADMLATKIMQMDHSVLTNRLTYDYKHTPTNNGKGLGQFLIFMKSQFS